MKSNTTVHHNIVHLFVAAAEAYPNKVAIVHNGKHLSYGQLLDEVKQTASYFKSKGIGKGDRVMVFEPMSIDLYRIVLALFYIGATAVFLDAWSGFKRTGQCGEVADCRGFVGGFKAWVLKVILPSLRKIPLRLSLKGRAKSEVAVTSVEGDCPALITFTTGSTGAPKAALRSHDFLKGQFDVLTALTGAHPDDVVMTSLPIVLFINLGIGATSVIPDSGLSAKESVIPKIIMEQLVRYGVTRLISSPQFVVDIAKEAGKHTTLLRELKEIFTGGGPVYPDMARHLSFGFPETKITVIYGSTEAEPISHIGIEELIEQSLSQRKGLAVGTIHPEIVLRIIHPERSKGKRYTPGQWETLLLEEEAIGEIVVCGTHVLKRYFRSPEAFEMNKIKVGDSLWHRTGDSGFIKDGQLFLTGRVSRLLKNGEKYESSFALESDLRNRKGIQRGTLLEVNKQRVLFIQATRNELNFEEALKDISFDKLFILKSMPVDPRHKTKINYKALENMV